MANQPALITFPALRHRVQTYTPRRARIVDADFLEIGIEAPLGRDH